MMPGGNRPLTRRKAVENLKKEANEKRRRTLSQPTEISPGDIIVNSDNGKVKIDPEANVTVKEEEFHAPEGTPEDVKFVQVIVEEELDIPMDDEEQMPLPCPDEIKILQETIDQSNQKLEKNLAERYHQIKILQDKLEKGLQEKEEKIQELREQMKKELAARDLQLQQLNDLVKQLLQEHDGLPRSIAQPAVAKINILTSDENPTPATSNIDPVVPNTSRAALLSSSKSRSIQVPVADATIATKKPIKKEISKKDLDPEGQAQVERYIEQSSEVDCPGKKRAAKILRCCIVDGCGTAKRKDNLETHYARLIFFKKASCKPSDRVYRYKCKCGKCSTSNKGRKEALEKKCKKGWLVPGDDNDFTLTELKTA